MSSDNPDTYPRGTRLVLGLALAAAVAAVDVPAALAERPLRAPVRVTVDFHDVDLPVFIRFISELTGKNFVLDDKIQGRVTVYSPTKVTVDEAYSLFLAALEVRQLAAVPKGSAIQIVQLAEVPSDRRYFVHKLRYASATETAAVLTSLVEGTRTTAVAVSRPARAGLDAIGERVEVFADKGTNSLVISGTPVSYERLRPVIEQLDVRRKQVFVEAVILEVGMDRLRQIGTDPLEVIAVGESGSVRGIAGLNRVPEDLSAFAQALTGSATGGLTLLNSVNARAFLRLLMSLTDTNILSTPQVLAAEHERARIVVGENRPFPTGQAQDITGGTIVTIERRDVGVTLEIVPQVLEDDLVRLDVKQEITAIAENVAQTIGADQSAVAVGPTTTKRAMETVTIARDQQTIVVGGLVRDNVTINENKIPLLGDIPLLGWLFKSESRRTEKLNLLVFLTPHILEDGRDVVRLNAEKGVAVETIRQLSRGREASGISDEIDRRLLKDHGVPGATSTPQNP